MSAPDENSEVADALSAFPHAPVLLNSILSHNVYDTHPGNDPPSFNDSNSDDTQFEIHSGELNSNQPSPVKDKPDFKEENEYQPEEQTGAQETPDHTNAVPSKVAKGVSPDKGHSFNSTDPTLLVDYFLAHDDLLQALDDYTRSVGKTSVFLPECAQSPNIQYGKWGVPNFSGGASTVAPMTTADQEAETIAKAALSNTETQKSEEYRPTIEGNGAKAAKFTVGKDFPDVREQKSVAAARKSEKRKPRTYSQAVPSQHCHICSRRPTETSPHAVCGNLLRGRCRKTICTKCFHQFRWDLKAARDAPPGTWECPHCRGECPQRAQCVIYNRTSDRRRMKLINHRKRKDSTKVMVSRKQGSSVRCDGTTGSLAESPNSGSTMMNASVMLTQDTCARSFSRSIKCSKAARLSVERGGIKKPVQTMGSQGQATVKGNGRMKCEGKVQGMSQRTLFEENVTDGTMEVGGVCIKPEIASAVDKTEVKSEEQAVHDGCMETSEIGGESDMTGIFGSMDLSNNILCISSGGGTTDGLNVENPCGSVGLEMSLDLPDFEDAMQKKNGVAGCEADELHPWTDEGGKFGELGVDDFSFPDSGVDLDVDGA